MTVTGSVHGRSVADGGEDDGARPCHRRNEAAGSTDDASGDASDDASDYDMDYDDDDGDDDDS